MSNLSGLPPSSVLRAASLAASADIAVRLIHLPDTIQDNPQPLRLSGTVKGMSPEGAVRVETDRGVIEILLKDKGSLPTGQKIEIEIPAGRPPASASIRPSSADAPPAHSSPPSLASYIDSSKVPPLRLDRGQNLKSGDMAEALTAAGESEEIRFSGALQAGQILRLIPISSMPQTLGTIQNAVPYTPEELLINLVNLIGQTTDLPEETRNSLIKILTRIDTSALPQIPIEDSSLPPSQQIQTALQKLAQVADLPDIPELPNAASSKSTPLVFNPAKPMDVQILSFQKTTFQTTLNQVVQTAISAPSTLPNAVPVTADDLVVLPQPAASPPSLSSPAPQIIPPSVPVSSAPASSPVIPAAQPVPIPVTAPATPVLPSTPNSATPPAPVSPPPVQPVSMPAPPPVLLGQVTGITQGGQPVLTLSLPNVTEPQLYVVQFQANNIVVGSPVIVSPLPTSIPAKQAAGFVPFGIGSNQNLGEWAEPGLWEPLQNLMAGAAHLDPSAMQSATRMLPSPSLPHNMAPLSLFILSVMRTGDLDSWVGEPVLEALKHTGKLDLIRAAAGETTMFQRLENAPLPNDWKATMLPFWHGGQINKLPLYFKKWNDDADTFASERREKLRFMFELNLSRMGAVQLDGFLQREKLDMILRTKAAISLPMQESLRKLYHAAMENSKLSGEITFQFKPEQWLSMSIETKKLV